MEKLPSVYGLTNQQAADLLKQHGENSIQAAKKTSPWKLLLGQYTNIITLILLVAVIFSAIIKEYVDCFFILLVLILNGFFGFIQEFRAEKTIEKLKDLMNPTARVLRDGKEQDIEAHLLVPGDVVVLREGDRIPADGLFEASNTIEVDESIFTGESLSVEKKKGEELFSGTFIVQGRGYLLVKSTGINTKLGEIAKEVGEIKKPTTPLTENLNVLAKRLAFIAIVLTLLLFPIGLWQGRELVDLILTSVSLAVAVIPEGLPLVVTMALAVGAYRMAKEKAIIRRMNAIETLGATSAILTDKTGTLTQNKMRLKDIWLPDPKHKTMFMRAFVLGNTATVVMKEDGGENDVIGDPTDAALLHYAQANVPDFEEFKKDGKLISEKPFDSETKRIEVEWEFNKKKYEVVRGAPESVVSLLDKRHHEKILKEIDIFARQGLRVIGFAYREKSSKTFTFLGLAALYDPPRPEAIEAIKHARAAGVHIVMVTGDNPVTALKISEEIGLIKEGELVLTSDELEKQTDEELIRDIPRIRIFARMKPHDKLRLVRLFKQAGYVVAVTGDGVNDALALAESNIGVAMGQSGTDVAKESADMVITDDNIYTVVKAVAEGRGIFDNIVKVVVFLFSSNAAEFLVIFLGILLGLPIPLTPTMILWVNLISDGLPALALATDKKRSNLLTEKPRDVKEQILNRKRMLFIVKITPPFAVLLVFIFAYALLKTSIPMAQLIVFNALVVGEMILVFVIRGGVRPFNKMLFLAVAVSLLLQFMIMAIPQLRGLFF